MSAIATSWLFHFTDSGQKDPSDIFWTTQMLQSGRHFNQALNTFTTIGLHDTKSVHFRFKIISERNKKKKESLNHLTRRPKKGNVSTHTHPDSHRPKHYRLDSNQPELCRRHMQSLHEKSTMCTNSSGPLQLPTIPVTGHPRNPLIHKVSCTFIRHKLILIVN